MLRLITILLIAVCSFSCSNSQVDPEPSSQGLRDTVPLADTNNHNTGNNSTVTLDSIIPAITPADTAYPD